MSDQTVPCQNTEGECEVTGGLHTGTGESEEPCTSCGDSPAEGRPWKVSDRCDHGYCREVEGYFRSYMAHRATRYSPDEVEAIKADRELMLDEFHGGDPE